MLYHKIIHIIRSKHWNNSKFSVIALLIFMLIYAISNKSLTTEIASATDLQESIAREIIRFHVIANSDSAEDQALKYKVKDALVKELSPILNSTSNIEEARAILKEHFTLIQELANAVIQENGYSYTVNVTLEPIYFPIKIYGDYTFPPGTYEALRVKIGEASGQNWWCVMFPPLCFVDETYSIVSDEAQEQLKYLLTEEEYETLRDQKVPVKVKFKLFQSLKKLFR